MYMYMYTSTMYTIVKTVIVQVLGSFTNYKYNVQTKELKYMYMYNVQTLFW